MGSRSKLREVTWDALFSGALDATPLAMELFPERVVRKCATDRALAKIHGLRDQLWMRRADGRWQARLTPMETLIRAKSSPHLALVPPTAADAPEPPPPRSRRKRGAATR